MGYGSTTTYAGVTIYILNINPESIQAPYIQKLGRTLSVTPVPTDTTAWRLTMNCELVGTAANMDSWRSSLQTAHDDKIIHSFVDGLHDGDFVCLNLAWADSGGRASGVTNMQFTMTLLEKKFSGGY